MEEIESYQSLDADLDYPAILIKAAGGGGQGEKGSGTGGREGGGEGEGKSAGGAGAGPQPQYAVSWYARESQYYHALCTRVAKCVTLINEHLHIES